MVGIVLDAETAEPISGAHVVIWRDDLSKRHLAASDDQGRFSFQNLPSGPARLLAQFIGYRSTEVSLDISPDDGYAARIGLTPSDVCMCTDYLYGASSITVHVRDVITGETPMAETVLLLHDGSYRDSASALPVPGDISLEVHSSEGRPGTYRVEIRAQGYLHWVRDSVIVDRGCCNSVRPRYLHAWLLPSDDG